MDRPWQLNSEFTPGWKTSLSLWQKIQGLGVQTSRVYMYLNFYTSKSKRKLQDTHVPMLFFVFSNDLFFFWNLFSVFPCENEELLIFFEVIILKSSQQKARPKVVGVFLQPSPANHPGDFSVGKFRRRGFTSDGCDSGGTWRWTSGFGFEVWKNFST